MRTGDDFKTSCWMNYVHRGCSERTQGHTGRHRPDSSRSTNPQNDDETQMLLSVKCREKTYPAFQTISDRTVKLSVNKLFSYFALRGLAKCMGLFFDAGISTLLSFGTTKEIIQ